MANNSISEILQAFDFGSFISNIWFLIGVIAALITIYEFAIKRRRQVIPPYATLANEERPNQSMHRIPYFQNAYFTGRDSILSDIRDSLQSGENHIKILTGLGGVGKTQLALEYVYRYLGEYNVILWAKSEGPTILANEYIELADELGLKKGTEAADDLIDAVREWFERNTGWLIIFDNAQSPSDLIRYLPKTRSGHIIVTSRNTRWEGLASTLTIVPFERLESVKFLLNRTGQSSEKAALVLAEELGDLPLALEQAGAYIKESGISYKDYLKRFQENREEILKQGKPDAYPETIATTWIISMKAAGDETPESIDLLNLCAYLSPDLIRRDMLVNGSEYLPDPLSSLAKNSMQMDKLLRSLKRYSLIDFSADGFFIHRMVQAVTQDRMAKEDKKKWAEVAVRLIEATFPKDHLDNPQSWAECSALLPHALAAAGYSERLEVAQEATGRLLNDCGLYLQTLGFIVEAKSALARALKIDEKVYGPDNPNVATMANNLGSVLRDLGQLDDAKKCFERALKIDEKVYGPDHPNVAIRVNNLGSVLRDLGQLDDAKKLYERALKILQENLGDDHPKTRLVAENLKAASKD